MQYGKIANLHVCKGTGIVCSSVTLQGYLSLQGQELSAVRYNCSVTCYCMDGKCQQYGNIATLRDCTGNVKACSTITLQSYMIIQGMEPSAVR